MSESIRSATAGEGERKLQCGATTYAGQRFGCIACALPWMKLSSSALTSCFSVVAVPCGAPLETLSVAFFMIFDDNIAEAPIGRPRLTWSGTSSKSARPANDFESCETVSIAEGAQCPLVRPPVQRLLLSSRRSRTKTETK